MTIKYHEWSEEQMTYPEFYKDKDRDWIGRQLSRLNFEQRKDICRKYRNLYLRTDRNEANKMLLDYCNENGRQQTRIEPQKAVTGKANPMQDRVNKLRQSPNRQRKSILDMADGK